MKALFVSVMSLGLLCGCAGAKPVTYSISWYNGDTLLNTSTVEKDATPEYEGETPTKTDSTGEYEYTFSGWSPEVVPAVEDAEYKAQFDKKRVNWSADERALQKEKLTVELPYFEVGKTDAWYYDEDYDCVSIVCSTETSDIAAAFAEAGYECVGEDEGDYEYQLLVDDPYVVDVEIYVSTTGDVCVDAYYADPAFQTCYYVASYFAYMYGDDEGDSIVLDYWETYGVIVCSAPFEASQYPVETMKTLIPSYWCSSTLGFAQASLWSTNSQGYEAAVYVSTYLGVQVGVYIGSLAADSPSNPYGVALTTLEFDISVYEAPQA